MFKEDTDNYALNEYLAVTLHNCRGILDAVKEKPLRYVGANHHLLAQGIHPYRRFDPFAGLDGDQGYRSASAFEAMERFAAGTLAIIREELDRFESELASSSPGAPLRALQLRVAELGQALYVCTADRIRHVVSLLKEPVDSNRDAEFAKELRGALLSADVTSRIRSRLGLRSHTNSRSRTVRRLKRSVRRLAHDLSWPNKVTLPARFSMGVTELEAHQDGLLIHYEEVKARWHTLPQGPKTFTADDLGMLRLALRRIIAASQDDAELEYRENILPFLRDVDERLEELLRRAPKDHNGALATLVPADDGLRIEAPLVP